MILTISLYVPYYVVFFKVTLLFFNSNISKVFSLSLFSKDSNACLILPSSVFLHYLNSSAILVRALIIISSGFLLYLNCPGTPVRVLILTSPNFPFYLNSPGFLAVAP